MSAPVTFERGEILRALREKASKTQRVLASESGVSQTLISLYEKGERGMGREHLERIAASLQVSVPTLLGQEPGTADEGELDGSLVSDPYPNRRRLRRLPEFRAAPKAVQEHIIRKRHASGDLSYFGWIHEFEAALELFGKGRKSFEPPSAKEAPPVRQGRTARAEKTRDSEPPDSGR